jgi:hypothetical protein
LFECVCVCVCVFGGSGLRTRRQQRWQAGQRATAGRRADANTPTNKQKPTKPKKQVCSAPECEGGNNNQTCVPPSPGCNYPVWRNGAGGFVGVCDGSNCHGNCDAGTTGMCPTLSCQANALVRAFSFLFGGCCVVWRGVVWRRCLCVSAPKNLVHATHNSHQHKKTQTKHRALRSSCAAARAATTARLATPSPAASRATSTTPTASARTASATSTATTTRRAPTATGIASTASTSAAAPPTGRSAAAPRVKTAPRTMRRWRGGGAPAPRWGAAGARQRPQGAAPR